MDQSDEEILALLATDIDTYYKDLIEKYKNELYLYILYRVNNQEDANDILMESFERAYYSLKSYSAQQQRIRTWRIRPWLYKITRNVCLNHITRYNKLHGSVSLEALQESVLFDVEDDRCMQPEVIVENAETRHELEALVIRLPQGYQSVMILRYFHCLTPSEIAHKLRLSEEAVRVKLFRGRRLLRQMA